MDDDGAPGIELCWGTVERAGPAELIDLASEAGFDSVTVTPDMFLRLGDREARSLRRRLADGDVVVNVIDALMGGLPGSPDSAAVDALDARFRRSFEYRAAECLDVAVQLDAPILNVAHFLGSPVETALLADAIGEVAAEARALDRRVTVEFIPGTGIPDLQTAVNIVVAIAADNVSIMLDTWHHARSGGTVQQLLQLPPRMVGGVQVSDRIEPPPGTAYRPMADRLLPGTGELPLAGILSAALENNPGLPVGVEVFNSELRSGPPADAAARAAEAIRTILRAAR
jgi:sugar phosphate isomerase/epimerase